MKKQTFAEGKKERQKEIENLTERRCQTDGRHARKKIKEVRLTKVDGLPADWTVAYHDSIELFIIQCVCMCVHLSWRSEKIYPMRARV